MTELVDKVILLATNNQDRTITAVVDGIKYEYWINGSYDDVLRRAQKLQVTGAHGRLITLLKEKSSRYDKLTA